MKANKIYMSILALALLAFSGCEDKIDPLVEELNLNRPLGLTNLTARIRNLTTIELDWNLRDVDYYVVEIHEDSLQFNNLVFTAAVTADKLPYRHTLAGETRYSARVKGVKTGLEDSKWATVTIATAPENIYLPLPGENVQDTYATLRWIAGSEVTHFLISPGNIQRPITGEEKTAGEATIEGLSGSTHYTVTLFNGNKRRGIATFSTSREANVFPADNLSTIIANAEDGAVLILAPGEYTTGAVALTKSITIEAQKSYDRPVIFGNFTCATTVASVTLKNLVNKPEGTVSQFFNALQNANIGTLTIEGCDVSGYTNSFISSTNTTATNGKFGSIVVSNCYVHDFLPATGGDGLDFRFTNAVGSLTVENTTFANAFRSFLRMQSVSNVSFRNCTFYKLCVGGNVDDSNNTGLFRLTVAGSSFEVRNSLFVATGRSDAIDPLRGGVWSRAAANMNVATPVYANNNVYNCNNIFAGLYTSAAQVNATELNPGFEDAGNANFKVTSQTLIDNNIGDPRWLQ